MSEEALLDDQSHYEVSLTAGQAFLAFVLLLLSLAASFAFGLLIGKGQGDDKFAIKRDAPVVSEASAAPKKTAATPAEVTAGDDDFKTPAATITEETQPTPVPRAEVAAEVAKPKPVPAPVQKAAAPAPVQALPVDNSPRYAQLLSTSDQKTAETLAARVIDGGFTSAYVERGATAKGPVFRVRVKFANETAAKAAEPKLKTYAKEVWITR
jgi:hypothetical protein